MFGWFRRSKVVEEARGQLADPDSWLLELFGATPTYTGITVSGRTAMRCAAARCAILAIAEGIAQLPLITYRRKDDGSKDRARDHSAYNLLRHRFNPWTSAFEGKLQCMIDTLTEGDGYLFINRAGGTVRELLRLDPLQVSCEADPTSGEPAYRLSGNAGQRPIPRQDLVHIKAPGFDGVKGQSPVAQCKEAIALALIPEKHASTLFAKGGTPRGVLTTDKPLPLDALKRIIKAWRAAFGSDTSSGGTPVLDNGTKYQQITLNSTDAQFLENRKHKIEGIARSFRVPPVFLMEYGRATWSNSVEMGRQFLAYTLMPWIERWESELRLKLFADDQDLFTEFLTDALVRPNLQEREEAYGKMIVNHVMTPSEARERENLPFRERTDEFFSPNTTPGPAT